ncbi:hypothetical protein D3C72_1549160 [compost metagenome]
MIRQPYHHGFHHAQVKTPAEVKLCKEWDELVGENQFAITFQPRQDFVISPAFSILNGLHIQTQTALSESAFDTTQQENAFRRLIRYRCQAVC